MGGVLFSSFLLFFFAYLFLTYPVAYLWFRLGGRLWINYSQRR